jgi:hypothetical protein
LSSGSTFLKSFVTFVFNPFWCLRVAKLLCRDRRLRPSRSGRNCDIQLCYWPKCRERLIEFSWISYYQHRELAFVDVLAGDAVYVSAGYFFYGIAETLEKVFGIAVKFVG